MDRRVSGVLLPLLALAAAARADVYNDLVTSDSPLAYWRLGSDYTFDTSGHSHTLTLAGSTGQGGALLNSTDQAVRFLPGIPSLASAASSNTLLPADGSFTIEAWVNTTVGGPLVTWYPYGEDGNATNLAFFSLESSGVAFSDNAGINVQRYAGSVNDGQWHHVAAVLDRAGPMLIFYVDGAEAGNANASALGTVSISGYTVRLGVWYTVGKGGSNTYYDGLLDEVAIYATALTSDRIRQHYLTGRQPLTVWSSADPGAGTLREAITYANGHAGADTITFDISGGGVQTISPTTALPSITEQLTIDGSTQPGYVANSLAQGTNASPKIALNGTGVASSPGLDVGAASCMIKGLVVGNCTAGGIRLNSDSNAVQGCFIGCNATGTSAAANAGNGGIIIGLGRAGNVIGGNTPDARNLISGNTGSGIYIYAAGTGNWVIGNLIGLNAAGTAALANGNHGVHVNDTPGVTIGGSAVAEGNVISGNGFHGISVTSSASANTTIQGNYIGTNVTGTAAVKNSSAGINVAACADTTIGGNTATPGIAPGNLISGQTTSYGIYITDTGASNTVIKGNLIGTSLAGTAAVPNMDGIYARDGSANTAVGGSTTGDGNVISGNTARGVLFSSCTGNVCQGNLIGVRANGTAALPNGAGGVYLATCAGNTIGGSTVVQRNVISGSSGYPGIHCYNGTAGGNTIQGNYIGTNPAGSSSFPNGTGIKIEGSPDTKIGGTTLGEGNLISGNTVNGILISGAGATGNTIQGNYIGSDATGTGALGNGSVGVKIDSVANNTVGPGNVIFANGADGVLVNGAVNGNKVTSNSIHGNAGLPLLLTNHGSSALYTLDAVVAKASCAKVTISSDTGNTGSYFELYGNPTSGYQATTYLGATPVGAYLGQHTVTTSFAITVGQHVTAMLTDENGTTWYVCNSRQAVAPTATQLSFTACPSSGTAGATLGAVTVTELDADNDPVSGATDSISVSIATGPSGGTLSGTKTLNASGGSATFSGLSLNKAGSYTLSATASGLTGATSGSLTVSPSSVDGNLSTLTASPTSVTADGTATSTLTVTVKDACGNPVPGLPGSQVVLTASPSTSVTIIQPGAATDANGQTTATVKSTKAAAVTFSATVDGTAITQTATVSFTVGAVSAGASSITANNVSPLADGVDTVTLTVTASDTYGNRIVGIPAASVVVTTASSSPVTLTPPATPTDSNGQTTAMLRSTVAQSVICSATISGTAVTASVVVNFMAGTVSASQSTLVADGLAHTANGTDTATLTVTAKDAAGNVIGSIPANDVVVSASPTTGVTLAQPATATDANGQTTATVRGTRAQTVTFSVTINGTVVTQTATVTFAAGPPAKLAFGSQPASTVAGGTTSTTVQVLDAFDNVCTTATPSVRLTLGSNPGAATLSGTTTLPAVAGVASFGGLSLDKAGTGYTLVASSSPLPDATSNPFNVAAGGATRLSFGQQPGNTPTGQPISPAVTVAVVDALGNVVTSAGPTVAIAIGNNSGGSTLSGTTAVATVNGVATFADLSLNQAGTGYTLAATSGGLTAATSVAFDVISNTATKLAFRVQPAGGTAGAALSPAVEVSLLDSSGNLVAAATNSVALAVGSNPGGATLSGTRTANARAGVATFTDLNLDKAGTGYTLSAASSGLTGTTSAPFDIVAGAASKLSFLQQPTDTAAGAPLAVRVQVLDTFGNPQSSATPQVTIAIGNNPGAATLGGTTRQTAVSGLAAYADLTLNRAGTGYTLTASATGLTSATSTPFSIGAGTAARLVFGAAPPDATAGAPITPAVTVRLEDAQGNLVATAATSVHLALTGGPTGSSLLGTVDQAAVNGVASFADLAIRQAGSGYQLIASGSGLTGATSGTFAVLAGPVDAAQSTVAADPTSRVANGTDTSVLTVTAKDAYGNPRPNLRPDQVILAVVPAPAPTAGLVLTQPVAMGNATGQSTGTLSASRPQTAVVQATVAGVTLALTATVTFTPRPVSADRSTVTLTPARIAADGHELATLTVVLRDATGAPVEGSPANQRELTGDGADGSWAVSSLGDASGPEGQFAATVTASRPGTYGLVMAVGGVKLSAVSLVARSFVALALPAGLRFVSLPLTPDAESVVALLLHAGVQVARYDPLARVYVTIAAPASARAFDPAAVGIGPGVGLWIRSAQAVTLNVTGEPVAAAPWTMALAQGWNAVGNPFGNPLPWTLSEIRVLVDGSDVGALSDERLWAGTILPYGWVWRSDSLPGYRLVFDPSRPGFAQTLGEVAVLDGLWVRAVTRNVSLRLPAPAAARSRRGPRHLTPRDWAVDLLATSGHGQGRALFGVSSGLTRALAIAEPPGLEAAGPVQLKLLQSAGDERLAGLVQAPEGGEQVWQAEASSAGADAVTLSWPSLLRTTPRGLVVSLTDQQSGQTLLLNTHSSYRYTPSRAGEARRFKLSARFGHLERPEITGLSLTATRGRSASLSLTLSGPARITVTVRGLGGRVVKELSQTATAAGTLTLSWDGTDREGRKVPAGSYLIEAVATADNGAQSRATRTVRVP